MCAESSARASFPYGAGNAGHPHPGNAGHPHPGNAGHPHPGNAGHPHPGNAGHPHPGNAGRPRQGREWFEYHYPGDFIVEYAAQTRGWFYNMHVLATALFDRPAFRNCMAHGIVLGSDGQKMSKSRCNYPDVNEVFERDGSDAMRWFLMASPILRGGNLVITERGIRDAVRQAGAAAVELLVLPRTVRQRRGY